MWNQTSFKRQPQLLLLWYIVWIEFLIMRSKVCCDNLLIWSLSSLLIIAEDKDVTSQKVIKKFQKALPRHPCFVRLSYSQISPLLFNCGKLMYTIGKTSLIYVSIPMFSTRLTRLYTIPIVGDTSSFFISKKISVNDAVVP